MMAQDGLSQDGYDSDSGYSEGERLMRLLKRMKRLQKDFSRALGDGFALNPRALNVSEALQGIFDLVQLSLTLCPKTTEDLWQLDQNCDSASDIISKLQSASHVAYKSICAKEKQLIAQQERVSQLHAALQDLVGHVERVERKSHIILEAMKETEKGRLQIFEQSKTDLEDAEARYKVAKKEAKDAEDRLKKKYEVNKNFFTGLADWLSREDDQFNLALSIGIGESQERQKDQHIMDFYNEELGDKSSRLRKNEKNLERAEERLSQLHEAQRQIDTSSQRTHKFKAKAVSISKDLIVRKNVLEQIASKLTDIENSMQMVDEETRLPTFGQVSTEVLLVLKASAKYQEYEGNLKDMNRQIWDVLVKNTDWQDLFDKDEELDGHFKEVEKLLA